MSDALTTLCLGCGLCCDGSLFTTAPLADAAEVAGARGRGLPVLTRPDGSAALRQPCAALVGRRCEIYEARPAACRRYRCMLFAALADGEVSEDEAQATVLRAHALLAAARAGDELSPETAEARGRAAAFLERRFRGHARR